MDHILVYTDDACSIIGVLNSLCIQVRATCWLESIPVKTLDEIDSHNAIMAFEGPMSEGISYAYCDDSTSIKVALRGMRPMHDIAVPGNPRSNGVAERQVQEVI